MTDYEMDRHFGQTPCLCGATDTWHPRCYRNKTSEQVKDAYRRVYSKLRVSLQTISAVSELRAAAPQSGAEK